MTVRKASTGAITERERSLSYGQALDGSKREAPGFTGHMEDPGIGLVYMQQRYYDHAIGRFLSVDPVGPLSNPINHFGRYHYANNNPYKYVDPDGRCGTRIKGASAVYCSSFKLAPNAGNQEPQGGSPPAQSAAPTPPPAPLNSATALKHYQDGSGTPLRMSFFDIDTSDVQARDFPQVSELVEGDLNGTFPIDSRIPFTTSGDQWRFLGNITLRAQGSLLLKDDTYTFSGTLKSFDDLYDFNRSTHRGLVGEVLTRIGAGLEGKPYYIEIRGAKPFNVTGER